MLYTCVSGRYRKCDNAIVYVDDIIYVRDCDIVDDDSGCRLPSSYLS